MKKFDFQLEAALRWRNTQLQLERARLQGLIAEETRLKQDLQKLEEERRDVNACLSRPQLQALDLRSLSSYLVGAEARAGVLREQMRKRVAATAQQRERLSLAERNARLLQELREKRYSEWKQELDREIESAATESWVAANYRQSKP